MKLFAALVVLATLLIVAPACAATVTEEPFSFGRLGKVVLYRPSAQPAHVVIFVSGDGGWNKGVVDMAKSLATLDAAVVGVDIRLYLRGSKASTEKCLYPAADFEGLSKYVQKKMGLAEYTPPVLVGYSSGATLVYGALVQAPPTTFLGAISLGFCPDLETPKPLCEGSGLETKPLGDGKTFIYSPAQHLTAPWIALQGEQDLVCSAAATRAFVKRVPDGEVVLLPKVGHGFSVERNWMPQFREAFERIVKGGRTAERHGDLRDLPVVEVPAAADRSSLMAIVISGDGGWAGIDRELADYLSKNGTSVVGLNSLKYFWQKRTPEAAGSDLARIAAHYLRMWKKDSMILIGYSFGADTLPIMAGYLSPDLRSRVRLVALLSPERQAGFEFHLSDWLGGKTSAMTYPVVPAIEGLRGLKILCFYGSSERDSLCRSLQPSLATAVELKGGHHYSGEYRTIAEAILRAVG